MITRDTEWTSYNGRRTKIKDLSDAHLANIIRFLERTVPHSSTLIVMKFEASHTRRLSPAFFDGPQTPHVGKDGKWHRWNYDTSRDEVISAKKAKL